MSLLEALAIAGLAAYAAYRVGEQKAYDNANRLLALIHQGRAGFTEDGKVALVEELDTETFVGAQRRAAPYQ